jgi:hypothetical protein
MHVAAVTLPLQTSLRTCSYRVTSSSKGAVRTVGGFQQIEDAQLSFGVAGLTMAMMMY